MSKPHTCPTCEGRREVAKNFGIQSSGSPEIVKCPTCEGEGVVWEGGSMQEAAPAVGDDPLDLRYRP